MMIVMSGTISEGRIPFKRMVHHPGQLRLKCARLELQRGDRRIVYFSGKGQFAAGGRP